MREALDYVKQLLAGFSEIGLSGLFDIAVVTLVIYSFLVALKRTRRSGLIFAGIAILGIVYLAALKFNLVLTVALLQGFFAVILVALVVIFQEDLRYFFERVGRWWVERRLPRYKRTTTPLLRPEVETLARTLGDLARARIGALVVLRGKDPIARHIVGGEDVQGLISEPLLKSIFDPHSIGHDGAVVVDGHLIEKLGCHLPLSKNLEKLPYSGTRHAAALGLSERSDALCVVVSEERGTISVARRGDIYTVPTPADLVNVLEGFSNEVRPRAQAKPTVEFFRRNYQEKAVALALAVALWVVVVQRAQVVERTFAADVSHSLLPSALIVTSIQPPKVYVTFSAQRKDFAFMKPEDVKVVLNLWDVKKGRRAFPVTRNELSFPSDLELKDIQPRQVILNIADKPAETNRVNHAP